MSLTGKTNLTEAVPSEFSFSFLLDRKGTLDLQRTLLSDKQQRNSKDRLSQLQAYASFYAAALLNSLFLGAFVFFGAGMFANAPSFV